MYITIERPAENKNPTDTYWEAQYHAQMELCIVSEMPSPNMWGLKDKSPKTKKVRTGEAGKPWRKK